MELWKLSALALGSAIRAGDVSAADAVRVALDRITAHNGMNNAFLTVCGGEATRQAERALGSGPLSGVPMAVKDNLCTKGVRTTCASQALAGYVPPYDATAVRWLAERGAILLGKLNMDEFAMGGVSATSFFGPARNPWDLNRSPGGSSGGAPAVAAEECWYALAADSGGSIRLSAAHCGVTGMKPSHGMVSRYGLMASAASLDQIGPIARDAADCAAVLDAIMGRDPRDAGSLEREGGSLLAGLDGDVRGLRLGIPGPAFGEGLDPAVARAVLSVAQVLQDRGAVVEWFTIEIFEHATPAYYLIASAEAGANLAKLEGVGQTAREEAFGEEVRRRVLMGSYLLADHETYYQKANEVRTLLTEEYQWAFHRFDLLLMPVTLTTAPLLGGEPPDAQALYRSGVYTVPANLAGLPALSLPCGFDALGLPIGAQLMGPALGDKRVLNAAYGYQQDTDWHTRRPEGA